MLWNWRRLTSCPGRRTPHQFAPAAQLIAFEAGILAAFEDEGRKRDEQLDPEGDQEDGHAWTGCIHRAAGNLDQSGADDLSAKRLRDP